ATNRFTVHLRQIATTYLVILIVAPSHPNCRAIGRISKQIAADLGISENAVKLYLRSARIKLNAATSYQAVAKASFLELIKF
ncbi:LuxR C-terminal-related transcriptional regulator, partial [Sinorhizobium meliloti]|uniref:LuxR C-terminal-related transcriptional regulator n=1 Tax=Rhizobium meliloti TaxID=382 RepID=UPI001F48D038